MSLEAGQCLTQETSNGSLMAVRWKDRKDVFMLSTEHSSVMAMSPARSAGRAGKMKPACVLMYNKYMGGVDTNDQMEGNYSLCRSSRKLWKKLVMYVVGLGITNAYVVHSMKHPTMFPRRLSGHKRFRLKLAQGLLTESSMDRVPSLGLVRLHDAATGRLHTPCYNDYTRKKPTSKDAPPPKMYCSVCKKKRTIYGCRACRLPFCIVECFHTHHEQLAEMAKNREQTHSDEGQCTVDPAATEDPSISTTPAAIEEPSTSTTPAATEEPSTSTFPATIEDPSTSTVATAADTATATDNPSTSRTTPRVRQPKRKRQCVHKDPCGPAAH